MSVTPRLTLPYLNAGQAQKEVVHNEALQLLDTVVAAAVEQLPLTTPPANPPVGSCYIVAAGATGDWAGKDHFLAARTAGDWRYIAPSDGLCALIRSSGVHAVYRSGSWEFGIFRGTELHIDGKQVVGFRQPAINSPAGGPTVDVEARSAIAQILGALRGHGLIET